MIEGLDERLWELIDSLANILPDKIAEEVARGDSLSLLGADRLIGELAAIIGGSVGNLTRFLFTLVGVAVLFILAELVPTKSVYVGGGVAILASFLLISSLYPIFLEVEETLKELGDLFGGIMPIVVGFIAIGGGTTLAPAASVGMQMTLYITGLFSSGLLLRLVIAMLMVSAISDSGGVSERVGRGLKGGFVKLLGIVTAVLGAIIALETYIAAANDGAAIRMAKLTAGNMIPMVGSAVSGAISTLAGGLGYVGGIIGSASVVAIISVALSPLVMLLLYRGCFYLVDLFLSFFDKGRGVSILSAFSGALDALISVYSMTIIIYILEVIVLIMGGGAIIG